MEQQIYINLNIHYEYFLVIYLFPNHFGKIYGNTGKIPGGPE